ncbi:MAG TPA: hypothetical protein VMU87_01665 [Stellaceae bacterium]|nr:hypothetical protein [Stellaceae bacterium]
MLDVDPLRPDTALGQRTRVFVILRRESQLQIGHDSVSAIGSIIAATGPRMSIEVPPSGRWRSARGRSTLGAVAQARGA